MIYADNAATTQLDDHAFEKMKSFLLNDYGNVSQPYAFSRGSKKALKEARITIANCIGALPEEIYFTSGGSESDNWAIKGLMDNRNCRVTFTSDVEHHAVLNACKTLARFGNPVSYLHVDKYGVVVPEILKKTIVNGAKLVSVMMANNEIGTIEPICELAEIAHAYGALFHTDAVQAVGHIPIDVKALGVDLLSASGHKFNAPKGVGFLFKKRGIDIYPYVDGGAQEAGLRAGTENVASIVAMAVALKSNCDNMDKNTNSVRQLEIELLGRLDKAGVKFIRNGGEAKLPGLLSLSFPGFDGEAILHRMDLAGICISTGSACNGDSTEISHVLRAINLDEKFAKGTVRISLGKDNTIEEIKIIANALIKITK